MLETSADLKTGICAEVLGARVEGGDSYTLILFWKLPPGKGEDFSGVGRALSLSGQIGAHAHTDIERFLRVVAAGHTRVGTEVAEAQELTALCRDGEIAVAGIEEESQRLLWILAGHIVDGIRFLVFPGEKGENLIGR